MKTTTTTTTLNNSVKSVLIRQYEKEKEAVQNKLNILYGEIIKEQEETRENFRRELQEFFPPGFDIAISQSSGYFTGKMYNLPKEFYSGIKVRELFTFDSKNNRLTIQLWMEGKLNKTFKFTKDTCAEKIARYVKRFSREQWKMVGK